MITQGNTRQRERLALQAVGARLPRPFATAAVVGGRMATAMLDAKALDSILQLLDQSVARHLFCQVSTRNDEIHRHVLRT